MRVESPHSVESPKLTPSPPQPTNVPANIHQVISYKICSFQFNCDCRVLQMVKIKWNCFCHIRKMSAEQHISIQRPIIRQIKRIVQSLPIHHCHYRIIVVHRISAIHNPRVILYTQGQHQMLSICNLELSSLLPFLYQMKCGTIFCLAMKLPIWLIRFQIQVNKLLTSHSTTVINRKEIWI